MRKEEKKRTWSGNEIGAKPGVGNVLEAKVRQCF